MAGEEVEVWKLIQKVEGEENLARLRQTYKALDEDFRQWIARFGQANATTQAMAHQLAFLEGQIKTAEAAMASSSGSTRNLSQLFIQLGYAADDAQYGVAGLANNIIPLLGAFGLGGGLAGVIGLASTAAIQLYKHSDQIASLFGQGATETEAQRMDRLAASTHRSADETKELNKHLERKAELEKLLATKSGGRQATEGAGAQLTQEAVGRFSGPGFLKQVEAAIRDFRTVQVEAQNRTIGRKPGDRTEFQKAEIDGAKKEAEDLVLQAQKGGAAAIDTLNSYLAAAAQRAGGVLAGAAPVIGGVQISPAEKRAAEEADRVKVEKEAAAKVKKEDEEAEKRRTLNQQLNEQGLENESVGKQDQKKADKEYRKRTEELNEAGAENEKAGREEAGRQAKEHGDDILAKAALSAGGPQLAAKVLKQRGDTPDAINGLLKEASGDLQQSNIAQLLAGMSDRHSQIVSSVDLSANIQQGVGGRGTDPAEKMLREQQRTNELLNRFLQRPPARDGVFLR
jgi:hypothetical protein